MVEIRENIYWLGMKDWGLRHFHGHELSTHRGSSYNTYIIKDQKTVLVDTVWDPYKEDFVRILDRDVGLESIDMIIINHTEPDHAGSLGYLLDKLPSADIPIYCTKNGADIIRNYFRRDDINLQIVKTGDTINIGKYDLVFVEMQMIHWPDSMLTYVKGAGTVFSNDAFGQHYVGLSLFNDEVDNCELYQDAIKYYANILTPFSSLIKKKIEQIRALELDIEMIAPSHGIIWRRDPMQIIDKYYEWSQDYNEGHAVIIYDTMYDATRTMAESIAAGLESQGMAYKLFNVSITDQSDLITEIFKAKGVIIGSCTVNNSVLRFTSGLLEEIKGHKFKGKLGAGFGSYGWSGEAPKVISASLEKSGLKIPLEPLGVKFRPGDSDIERCIQFGESFAAAVKE
ncbi:MAG: MBL fold metallo-hydrolase [Clostridiaceae bacterium]|nr:MBL fold metallo-hydrolase [Clostridiaceae bacterium]